MKSPHDCTNCPRHTGIDRRTLLIAGATGSLVVATMPLGCGSDGPTLKDGPIVFSLNVSAVPVGFMMHIPNEPGFLARDTGGLYAMSAICTHMGCLLPAPYSALTTTITCGCHNSQFDRNGAVVRSPAQSPLQHYRVDLATDGTITIQGNVLVASNARTPVG